MTAPTRACLSRTERTRPNARDKLYLPPIRLTLVLHSYSVIFPFFAHTRAHSTLAFAAKTNAAPRKMFAVESIRKSISTIPRSASVIRGRACTGQRPTSKVKDNKTNSMWRFSFRSGRFKGVNVNIFGNCAPPATTLVDRSQTNYCAECRPYVSLSPSVSLFLFIFVCSLCPLLRLLGGSCRAAQFNQ